MNILPADDQITAFGAARTTIAQAVLKAGRTPPRPRMLAATLFLSLGRLGMNVPPGDHRKSVAVDAPRSESNLQHVLQLLARSFERVAAGPESLALWDDGKKASMFH